MKYTLKHIDGREIGKYYLLTELIEMMDSIIGSVNIANDYNYFIIESEKE